MTLEISLEKLKMFKHLTTIWFENL
jgi:hypothetical protein